MKMKNPKTFKTRGVNAVMTKIHAPNLLVTPSASSWLIPLAPLLSAQTMLWWERRRRRREQPQQEEATRATAKEETGATDTEAR